MIPPESGKAVAMRVLVAGATGAIGRQLVPRLVARGHDVTGMTHTASKQSMIEEQGASAAVADALDAEAVERVVAAAKPEVMVIELTALDEDLNPRKMKRYLAKTNRLRTEGTDNLLAAASRHGVRRVVAQSFEPLIYARTGSWVKNEDDPVDTGPPEQIAAGVAAIRHLEGAVTGTDGIEGLALRYGGFFGEGTSIDVDPMTKQLELIKGRKFPVVGSGDAVWSFIHIADAAEATAIAVERGDPGIYNVTDDSPAALKEWLPKVADALDAPPPRHIPRWVGRLLTGEVGAMMMTELRGASNEKAKRELDWHPDHPSLWDYVAHSKVTASPAPPES